jgi:hypothetical protein
VSSWRPSTIQTSLWLQGTTAQWKFAVNDTYTLPSPRSVQGETAVTTSSCDATLTFDVEASIDYLVRFTSTDTRILAFSDVIAVVNNDLRRVSGGAVVSGASVWINLGPCNSVANYDFIIKFTDPNTGDLRTATPDPPPLPALPACQDAITFADLGKAVRRLTIPSSPVSVTMLSPATATTRTGMRARFGHSRSGRMSWPSRSVLTR